MLTHIEVSQELLCGCALNVDGGVRENHLKASSNLTNIKFPGHQ